MYIYTDIQTGRQIVRLTVRQGQRGTEGDRERYYVVRHIEGHSIRDGEKESTAQPAKKIGRPRDRQTDRQTDARDKCHHRFVPGNC